MQRPTLPPSALHFALGTFMILTRQNWPRRYEVEEHETAFSVFAHNVRLMGASKTTRYEGNEALKTELQKMFWYVLSNCKEIKPYIEYVLTSLVLISMLQKTL